MSFLSNFWVKLKSNKIIVLLIVLNHFNLLFILSKENNGASNGS